MKVYLGKYFKVLQFFFFLTPYFLKAQYFGGEQNDRGVSFCEVDSNFYLTGTTRSAGAGSEDVWFVKINSDFESVYNFHWGGPHHDVSSNILATSDNNFIVLGYSWDAPGIREDIFVTKYNQSGGVLWVAYFGGTASDFTYGLEETMDGGYLITGINRSEGPLGATFLIKLDSGGVKQWEQYYDTGIKDIGKDVVEGPDSSLYLLINTGSYLGKIANSSEYQSATSEIMIVKTDKLGNEIWRKNYGGVHHDFCSKIIRGINDNFYFVGSSLNNTNGSYDITLNKIDSAGNNLWRKNYGGISYDYAYDIDIDINGDMIITGESNSLSENLNSDIHVIKVDIDGDELWTKPFGGEGSDYGRSGKFLSDGSIGILGTSNSKNNEDFDFYFIKIDTDGEIVLMLDTEVIVKPVSEPQVLIYPNPASTYVRINLFGRVQEETSFDFNLYDMTGKLVESQKNNSLSGRINFNSILPSGIYSYQINTSSKLFQGKIIIN